MAVAEFDVCPEAPYYHSGIKIIGNSFDTVNAIDLLRCKDVLIEGNTQSAGLPFNNRFLECADIIEK